MSLRNTYYINKWTSFKQAKLRFFLIAILSQLREGRNAIKAKVALIESMRLSVGWNNTKEKELMAFNAPR